MGDYYQLLDRPHFSYDLYKIDGITNTSFRGPRIDRSKPYAACLGAAETFGRFAAHCYPALLKDKFVVVVVLSGRSESNSLFDNRASGNLMGVRKADKRLMRFEEFVSDLMKTESRDRVMEIIQETRASYVSNMMTLLQKIYRPKILFWFSMRTPEYQERFGSTWELLGDFPQIVNRKMIDMLRPYADHYVECVTSRGMPQQLWQASQAVDGTVVENGRLVNRYYPSPEMHEDAASSLAPVCARYIPAKRPAKRKKAR
jgi:hypothetical protein